MINKSGLVYLLLQRTHDPEWQWQVASSWVTNPNDLDWLDDTIKGQSGSESDWIEKQLPDDCRTIMLTGKLFLEQYESVDSGTEYDDGLDVISVTPIYKVENQE